jgi:purine-binding chemotaxis protein CheW
MAEAEPTRPLEQLSPDEVVKLLVEEGEIEDRKPAEQERILYLGFYLGKEVYGLPLRKLREVARLARIRTVPGTPTSVAGLVNLRGKIICVLDVKTILGLSYPSSSEPRFLIVLEGVAEPLGLVVDSISDIYSIEPDQIESPLATWPQERAQFFMGTVRVQSGLMGLLDLERLVMIP